MSQVRCPYCGGTQGRCTTSAAARPITECVCCGRVVEERRPQPHDLFFLRAQDSPLCLVTPDLLFPTTPLPHPDDDPFETTGFITAFSTWSLELCPLFAHSASSFSGYLAELERVLLDSADGSSPNAGLIDNLRAYLQIIDVSSILGLDRDISDHAIQLFRDCSCTTYLRNRNVEALATAALVQAIREAQEPRTLQEISAAANVPQKEIGKYIKILGDALQLSQPINSNSISVHMPRFCSLLQLNKSTQDLATHIGEVVINKCFCTRRNPISISAAAIYLSCQLEDKRKTQAEICKVTGLTEVTLRKVYKELLENWDNLLPPNYTPAVPPERAFPMTMITSGRSSLTSRIDAVDISPPGSQSESQKQSEVICKSPNLVDVVEGDQTSLRNPLSMPFGVNIDSRVLSEMSQTGLRKHSFVFGMPAFRPEEEKNQKNDQCNSSRAVESEQKAERDPRTNSAPQRVVQGSSSSMATNGSSTGESASAWPFRAPLASGGAYGRFVLPAMVANFEGSTEGIGNQIISDKGGGSLNASKKFHGGGGGGLATCNSSNHMKQMPFHLSANTELGGGACDFSDGHEGGC